MIENTSRQKIGLLVALSILLAAATWSGFQLFEKSNARAEAKADFSVANSIVYGIFSAQEWKEEVHGIIEDRIREFNLNPKQDSLLRAQVNDLLNGMVTQIKRQVNEEDESLGKKLRKISVNLLVDWEQLRAQVPQYTATIVKELKDKKSKKRMKTILQRKLDELASKTYDQSDSVQLQAIYSKYQTSDLATFNESIKKKVARLEKESYQLITVLLAIIAVFLLLWIITRKQVELHSYLFVFSVLLGLVPLLTGLATPMIEIDARIENFEFVLLGEKIAFHDQILFYRSKSILEVVYLLFQSAKLDSLLVGGLVLVFSVLLPISKLSANGLYLFLNDTFKQNRFLNWLTFQSGKWSMADVLVVAIFMAFVGFDGILESNLQTISFDQHRLSSIATNHTSLLSGFTLFFTFVIYSLLLSEILSRLIKGKSKGDRLE